MLPWTHPGSSSGAIRPTMLATTWLVDLALLSVPTGEEDRCTKVHSLILLMTFSVGCQVQSADPAEIPCFACTREHAQATSAAVGIFSQSGARLQVVLKPGGTQETFISGATEALTKLTA